MLENYISIARSFIHLMKPFIEVVIHDLSNGKIVFIEGGLSKREVGSFSYLEEDIASWGQDIVDHVYPKLELDGRILKSISVPLKEGEQIGYLMCINFDCSPFQDLKRITELFMQGAHNTQPLPLFKKDWNEQVHSFVREYLEQQRLTLDQLTTKHKHELIRLLFDHGAFAEKRSVDYIAKVLKMGRATIFNHLRKWRK